MFYSVTGNVSPPPKKCMPSNITLHSSPHHFHFLQFVFPKTENSLPQMTTHPHCRNYHFKVLMSFLLTGINPCSCSNGQQGLQSHWQGFSLSHASLHSVTLISKTLSLLGLEVSFTCLWAFLLYPTPAKSHVCLLRALLWIHTSLRQRNPVAYISHITILP